MKRLLTLFLVLWCSTAWAVEPINLASTNPYVAGAGVAAASTEIANCSGPSTYTGSSGCILRETFEGCNANCSSGCDVAWSQTGTPACGTGSPSTLEGTKSFGGVVTTQGTLYKTVTAADSYYIAAKVYTDSCSSAYPDIFKLETSAATAGNISYRASCDILGQQGGGTNTAYWEGSTADAVVYFKMKVVKGTGANAEMTWWSSADGTTWTQRGTSTNGTWTGQVVYINLQTQSETRYVDDVRVSTSDINY